MAIYGETTTAWLGEGVVRSRQCLSAYCFYASHCTGPQRESLLALLKSEREIGAALEGVRLSLGLPPITVRGEAPKSALSQRILGELLTLEAQTYREVLSRSADPGYGAVYETLAGRLAAQQTAIVCLWGQFGG